MPSDALATGSVLLYRLWDLGDEMWRADIARKLETLRATYTMLHNETQTTRAHLLEIAIVLLFVIDIALALLRR